MGAGLAAVGLQQLVLAGAWTAQTPSIFPSTLPASQAAAPQPLIPFVVEGEFQTDGAVPAAGWSLVKQWTQSASQSSGFRLSLEGDRRLRLSVARFDGLGEFSCYSQQRNLDDPFPHRFVAVVSDEAIQLNVDGLFGVSINGGCLYGDEPGHNCGFRGADPTTDFMFGGDACCPGQAFAGTLGSINLRRPQPHELPRATAADPNAQSPSTPAPAPADDGGSDTLFFVILIPALLIVGVALCGLGACFLFKVWQTKQEPVLATAATVTVALDPPAAVASAGATTTTAAAPLPATLGASLPAPRKAASERSVKPEDAPITTPASWARSLAVGSWELVEADAGIRSSVQALMDGTWRDVITRDRTRGGSTSLNHFEVVQVLRNENPKLWHEYAWCQRAVLADMSPDTPRVSSLTAGAPGFDVLDERCNEFYLFHGSKPSSLNDICKNDFLLKLAGAHRGTLYGPGVYFAESSSKADEYSEDDKTGIFRGLYAMVMCRVTLGRVLVTEEVWPDGAKLEAACRGPEATHHSVLGDREKTRGTYREFVVFNSKQAYPEFVVIYRRSGS